MKKVDIYEDVAIQCCNLLSESNNITYESSEALFERMRTEMKRKEILAKHTPAIRQLGDGRYYSRIDGKLIRKKNLKELEDIIVRHYQVDDLTINDIFPAFMQMRKTQVSVSTCSDNQTYYEKYVQNSKLGKKIICKIDIDDGYEFFLHCKKIKPDMKQKYWKNIIGMVNRIMEYAIIKKIITDNPFRYLKINSENLGAKSGVEECDTVFSKVEQRDVYALAQKDAQETQMGLPLAICLLFNLGLRVGELCSLKWKDIIQSINGFMTIYVRRELVTDVDERTLKRSGIRVVEHCKSKAGERKLQLNKEAISILKMVKEYNQMNQISCEPNDFIFQRIERWGDDKGTAKMCTSRSIDARLRKYCRQAGMQIEKSPHDIRRTVLSNLYLAGMPIKKISAFAGHSSIQQTMDYLRLSENDFDNSDYLEILGNNNLGKGIEKIVSF